MQALSTKVNFRRLLRSFIINNLKVKTALKLITLTLVGLLNAEIITVTLGLNIDTFYSKNLFFLLFPLSETVFVARKSQRFIKNMTAKQQREQKALFNWSSLSKMVKNSENMQCILYRTRTCYSDC